MSLAISRANQRAVTLAESLVALCVLQIGVLGILTGILTLTKQNIKRDDRTEAGYLAHYMLGEILTKEYAAVYDTSTTRGLDNSDDLGYDRMPKDPFDDNRPWDPISQQGNLPNPYSDNDGDTLENSFGENDGTKTRKEWDDVDDYHGFTWGPNFTDDWGTALTGDYSRYRVGVTVESVRLSNLTTPVAWNPSTGAKLITVTVTVRGDTVLTEKALRVNDPT